MLFRSIEFQPLHNRPTTVIGDNVGFAARVTAAIRVWLDSGVRTNLHKKWKMRLVTLTSVVLLLSASCALAQGTSNTMTSGRPSAVLDDATCQTIWQMASPNGATISQDQAVPYIVNFKMVDVDGDGAISADEFIRLAAGQEGGEGGRRDPKGTWG